MIIITLVASTEPGDLGYFELPNGKKEEQLVKIIDEDTWPKLPVIGESLDIAGDGFFPIEHVNFYRNGDIEYVYGNFECNGRMTSLLLGDGFVPYPESELYKRDQA